MFFGILLTIFIHIAYFFIDFVQYYLFFGKTNATMFYKISVLIITVQWSANRKATEQLHVFFNEGGILMNLENMTKIYARGDSRIQLKVIPGHFVTSQSHITHYLDLTTMKSRTAEAQNIAHELAANYEVSTHVDTIICMDGLEVIGAYLSEELTKAGIFP